MKLGYVIAAAVLLAPIPFAGMENPAAASPVHTVVVNGTLVVRDGGSSFDYPKRKITERVFHIPTRTFTLRHGHPGGALVHRVCAADETRGELRVKVLLQPSGRVDALAELKLFEESVCENLDLEGKDYGTTSIRPGQTGTIGNLLVKNGEFNSFDLATAAVTVTQNPVPPILIDQFGKHCSTNPEACKI
ncbi:hypothetical protein [Streptomyces xanthophaeus]|uniref:hypothetical protein n=1 Tax=Streptomyces xanthophaeus TaxID=67385 RepID=UPI0036658F06